MLKVRQYCSCSAVTGALWQLQLDTGRGSKAHEWPFRGSGLPWGSSHTERKMSHIDLLIMIPY
jgi:hypothetical protein